MFTLQTMHPNSTSEMQQVIASGIVRNWGRVGHSIAVTDGRRVVEYDQTIPVLTMSAKATEIRGIRYPLPPPASRT
ncbi:hypothetical protein TNCV_4103001 [Trichonephila clavipes]|nr:hypothetical protein TNCV_4103001 [Trichonephila clavipes]